MANLMSRPSGELSPGGMAGDEAKARRNLSEGPDTLMAMSDPQSHPSGGLTPGETTTRPDAALGLLADRPNPAAGGGGSVNLHVDLACLARLDDNPADLAGYGLIASESARRVAGAREKSTWPAAATGSDTGAPLHVISVKRRPTSKQRHMIRVLHPPCVFPPGCRVPAVGCDLDHRIDHTLGGLTTVENRLRRRRHMAEHRGGWSHVKTSREGGVERVSPLGHPYQSGGSRTGGRSPP